MNVRWRMIKVDGFFHHQLINNDNGKIIGRAYCGYDEDLGWSAVCEWVSYLSDPTPIGRYVTAEDAKMAIEFAIREEVGGKELYED